MQIFACIFLYIYTVDNTSAKTAKHSFDKILIFFTKNATTLPLIEAHLYVLDPECDLSIRIRIQPASHKIRFQQWSSFYV